MSIYNTLVPNSCIAKSYFQIELGVSDLDLLGYPLILISRVVDVFVKYPKNHSFDFLNNTNYSNCTDFYTKL